MVKKIKRFSSNTCQQSVGIVEGLTVSTKTLILNYDVNNALNFRAYLDFLTDGFNTARKEQTLQII